MGKRIISILFVVCLCVTALAGCGGSSGSGSGTTSAKTEDQTQEAAADKAKEILGIICDAESAQMDLITLCESCGLDYAKYIDYTPWLVSDKEESFEAATGLIGMAVTAGCDCTTIIFAVRGVEQIAEDFLLQYPEIEVIIPDFVKAANVEVEPIIENTYTIDKCLTEFVNNRAWVTCTDSNYQRYYGVIDENFFLVYSVPSQELSDRGWNEYYINATDFIDGIACIYPDRDGSGMIVVGSNGHTIFDSAKADDGYKYDYLGLGGGTILAMEMYSDFSTKASYRICEIDYTGEVTYKGEPYSTGSFGTGSFIYCGEDVFIGRVGPGEKVYNRATHALFDTYKEVERGRITIHDVQDESFLCEGWWSDNLYLIPKEYLSDQTHWDSLNLEDYNIGSFTGSVYIAEGLINNHTGVYDYTGRQIAAYPENWHFTKLESFSDGYLVVFLKGADFKKYITILDTSGTPQYDPIKYDEYHNTWRGYISIEIDGEPQIIDPTGRTISEEALIDIKKTVDGNILQKEHDGFVDLDSNRFTTVYAVSNYDELAEQGYRQTLGEPESDIPSGSDTASESDAPVAQKNYITVSGFKIEGKWKNVGTYTFGQVQSGAIIAFDGTNCNFYSPKDTYAFYKDGDHYKLECTSLLAETLSFTVKIVDKNNVDVFVDSDILELTRVE